MEKDLSDVKDMIKNTNEMLNKTNETVDKTSKNVDKILLISEKHNKKIDKIEDHLSH